MPMSEKPNRVMQDSIKKVVRLSGMGLGRCFFSVQWLKQAEQGQRLVFYIKYPISQTPAEIAFCRRLNTVVYASG